MTTLPFENTKLTLQNAHNALTEQIHSLFRESSSFWEKRILDNKYTLKEELAFSYSTNHSIIQTIHQVQDDILEGKLNNHHEYYESDLGQIEVMLTLLFQTEKERKHVPYFTINELKKRIISQLETLSGCIEYFPEDLANNVKRKPKVITKLSLDYYQLIYTSILHCSFNIQNIILFRDLMKLTEEKTIST